MTRISSVNDPAYQIELLKGRVEALERRNPLNSASIDPDVPGISAGSNVFNSSGFQFMWGGELRTMPSVAAGLNSKADGIQSYAEGVQAYAEDIDARQSQKPTTAWVQARIDNLQGQINNAASSGDVAGLLASMVARTNSLQAQIDWIKDTAAFPPERWVDPPPPINQSG